MDAQHVVVGREHAEGRLLGTRASLDGNLGVVNTREVARAGWLVLFWLEGEGVRVHTWHWGARVVNEWLDSVEVLASLFLEAVLTVEDKLEGVEGTIAIFGEVGAFNRHHWGTREGAGDEAVGFSRGAEDVRGDSWRRVGGVPGVGTVIQAEDEFLDWVVVRQALLDFGAGGDGVGASVLHLLDEVFVTLLCESAALFGVQVDVVSPHLERTVSHRREGSRQIEVEADFVVLEGNQRQRQTWVAVEEEDEWQEDLLTGFDRGGHLTVVGLLGFVKVQLRVQTPPLLVVLVDALATNRQFNVLDHALREPGVISRGSGTGSRFNVHVGDEITVAGNRHGHATAVTWGTVNSLFDVFHREVSVALVDGLEESNLWVTSQVDVLSTVSDELHETTGHCESFCTIYIENNFAKKLSSIFPGVRYTMSQPEQPQTPEVDETESEYETDSELGVELEEDGSQPIEMYDEDELDGFLEDDDDDTVMKIVNIAGSLFASEEGDTVCTALVNISKQLEMQNRIMVKMLAQMQKST